MTLPKVPLGERALIQRINRKLAKDGQVLKKLRGERWRTDLGEYYVVDLANNALKTWHVDLVAFAKELQVISPWEEVREEAHHDTTEKDVSISEVPLPIDESPPVQAPAPRQKQRKDALPQPLLEAIAEERTHCEGLTIREFAQRLYDKGIYRATSRKDGTEQPGDAGWVHRQLAKAKAEGLL